MPLIISTIIKSLGDVSKCDFTSLIVPDAGTILLLNILFTLLPTDIFSPFVNVPGFVTCNFICDSTSTIVASGAFWWTDSNLAVAKPLVSVSPAVNVPGL